MAYQIAIKESAIKSLAKIPEPYLSTLRSAIFNLADVPRQNGCKKLKGKEAYRICVSDYRVIYEIADKFLYIEVIAIGHRKDIYE
ncbi:type II toxin-antitoxin system RelE/ParE family toxin [Algoriphagus sp. AGSA1]|uniref:type II toxin-antitoxin system RelE family toxin n=1 Tax=Algoriphagus sp. AGSA1 TaxID=2907213 RepID=UPI001F1B5789|nr:type II toxin-antitoxin system RelE/ParE family toxin [Algoriphagus sp. AGSA1]MCE7055605.1 type II toxin-antitoxin system RelE/ParE family toxin [Algoriphagus sp. AGSA1]